MPTKALLHVSDTIQHIRAAAVLGVRTGNVEFDFAEIMERKSRLIGEFAEYRRSQLRNGPFEFIHEFGRFADPRTLELSGGRRITAAHFIIATGSHVAPCPIEGLEDCTYLTSDDALALKDLPKSMIVLGGGAVAVEFAQFFARLGVQVSMIQRSPHILTELDQDAAEVIEHVFRKDGIRLFTGTQLLDGTPGGPLTLKKVMFRHGGEMKTLEAEEIFYGLGRTPSTQNLGLEKAGVHTERHRIITDEGMRTSAPHIYAAGDCRGLHEIVHLAVQHGELAAHNILHPEAFKTYDYRLLTSVIFTDPQTAFVGLTEKRAKAEGIPFIAASYPFNDHGKSILMEANDGFVKLLANPNTGEIIGGGVTGFMGGELIHEIIAAMQNRMTARQLAEMPHYHPTLAEIWTYPAEELAGKVSGE